ncbi:hypothetical protein HDU83_002984 [Entophlyctis luteolus]|nr:hypothetical protein HDU83_002984 [Entophlyctis luteolus]
MPSVAAQDPLATAIAAECPGLSVEGKVLLIVNVASKCGFTHQYAHLEALYKKYMNDGFLIIGVPTNDFKQEPADTDVCRLKYGVSFPVLKKAHVNGPDTHPLFKFLKAQKPHFLLGNGVLWNFEKCLFIIIYEHCPA